ncbi:MAG: DUF559 domain-containing protein [Bacteroidales bacterium]
MDSKDFLNKIKTTVKQFDENAGFKVMRFIDKKVLKNMNNVMDELENVIEELELSTPNPRQRGTKTGHIKALTDSNLESVWRQTGFKL